MSNNYNYTNNITTKLLFTPTLIALVITVNWSITQLVLCSLPPVADVIALKEGSDLDLNCPIEVPKDDLIISWTCNDEPANIRSSRIRVTDSGNLRIYSAKVGDSCDYRCETAGGFGTISVVIKVIIVDKNLLLDKLPRKNSTLSSMAKHHHQVDSFKPTNMPENYAPGNGDKNKSSTATIIQQDQMEIELEPSEVHINPNRTFGLECKVKHANQISMPPQIIWLKELTGSKPASLSEAHERNIILIDNGFYHTLNWPKSITHRRKSSSTNSVLLVRQANSVHSGRYICLAGYPPTIMGSNLTFATSASLVATSQRDSSSNGNQSKLVIPSQFDYKMAAAIVKVSDNTNGQPASSSIDNAQSEDFSLNLMPTNRLLIFALILALIFMLCIMLVLIFIYFNTNNQNNLLDCLRGKVIRNNKNIDNAAVESSVISTPSSDTVSAEITGHELYSSPIHRTVAQNQQTPLDGDHLYSEIGDIAPKSYTSEIETEPISSLEYNSYSTQARYNFT